jgi:hypothetical protein
MNQEDSDFLGENKLEGRDKNVPHFSDSHSCWKPALVQEPVAPAYASPMELTPEDHYMVQLVVCTDDCRRGHLAPLAQLVLESVLFLTVLGAPSPLSLAPYGLASLLRASLFPEKWEFPGHHIQPACHTAQQGDVPSPSVWEVVH